MNALTGEITTIEVNGNLSLVGIKVGDCHFKSIIVETPDTLPYLTVGNCIKVLFKETEVILGQGQDLQISLRNKMPAEVLAIEKGRLLAKLKLATNAGDIISIITSNAVEQLQLAVGSRVMAMVKTNEILLAKC